MSALLQNMVITGNLPLHRQLFGNPPDRRMKKEHRQNELLNQIGPIIASPHMSQFMTKHKLGFPWFHAFLHGQENHWMKKSQ